MIALELEVFLKLKVIKSPPLKGHTKFGLQSKKILNENDFAWNQDIY